MGPSGENALRAALIQLERGFDLGRGFLVSLVTQDSDWSFVIKAHALLEAATTQVLAQHFGFRELADVLSELPQSDTRLGRVAFMRALGLLEQDEIQFLRKFSELRNKLVHDVHNTRFAFVDYLATLPNPADQFAGWVAIGPTDPTKRADRRQRALSQPKVELWYSVVFLLSRCERSKSDAQERQRQIETALHLLEEGGDEPDDDEPDEE